MKNTALEIHRWKMNARRSARGLGDRAYLLLNRQAPARSIPDFAIIGAMKTGTTSLHNYLDTHPDVYMTYVKEPGLFLDASPYMQANPYIRSRADLERLTFRGYNSQRVIGESSTHYTEAPTLGAETPQRMRDRAPDIKLVYMLRNPFDRILSHYWHCVDLNIYSEGIDSVLAMDGTFLERSRYYYQLSRYLEHFDRSRFHVLLLEDFKKDRIGTLNAVFDFLGVGPLPADAPAPERQYNQSVSRTQGQNAAAKLSPASYRALIEPIEKDVAELERFLGRSLDQWDLSAKRWSTSTAQPLQKQPVS